MKRLNKIVWLSLALMVLCLGFLLWYQNKYAMDVVEPYEVNSNQRRKSLLIATQGSDFKRKLTAGIVAYYASDAIYIKIIDVSSLETRQVSDYNALLIIHTWEKWKAPKVVESFIERTKSDMQKIVVLTTSGEGNYKMDDVDAITGESILENVPTFIDQITSKLNPLLKGSDGYF